MFSFASLLSIIMKLWMSAVERAMVGGNAGVSSVHGCRQDAVSWTNHF